MILLLRNKGPMGKTIFISKFFFNIYKHTDLDHDMKSFINIQD